MKFNSIFTTTKKKDYAYKVRQLNDSAKKIVLDNVGVFKYLDRWWDRFLYNLNVEVEDVKICFG